LDRRRAVTAPLPGSPTPPTRAIPGRAFTSVPRAPGRALRALTEHPIAAIVLIALLARIAVAVGAVLVTDRYTIPDETLYLELGRNIVHGISPDEWYPGYGQSLYDSIQTYSVPLMSLFCVFGPGRLLGALFSAVVGAACAGVTVAITKQFLRPAFALSAGLIVALLPSQVLFSSVVLREAHVWLCLTIVAGGALLLMSVDWRRIAVGGALAALGVLGLGYLRDQTMFAAAWALALAVIVTPRQLWPLRVTTGLAVAALIPLLAGNGIGGWNLVNGNATTLAKTRATLAVGANSAFGGATPPPGPAPTTSSSGTVSDTARAAANRDEGLRAGIGHLPSGLVDVTLRPFPWQSTAGLSLLMARIETVGWYVLYALAIAGILVSLRRRQARLTLQFPVVLMGLLIGIAALTQGNLGTAFRHRDQMVWALALCAAAGLQWLSLESRWSRRRVGAVAPAAASVPVDDSGSSHADHALTR
jgi:hypothetical protein